MNLLLHRKPALGSLWLTALCALACFCSGLQAEVTVGASLQPAVTNVGEPVQLSITVNGTQSVDQIPGLAVDGAQTQHIGQNTQIQLINSALTVSLTHRYLVSPTRVGELDIPAIDVLVGGKRYQTAPLKLKVLDVGQDPSGNAAPASVPTAEVELPNRPVYVGESFPVEVRLVVPSEIRWRIERMPDFETDSFTKTPFQQPQQRQQKRDGKDFEVCNFRTTLTAVKSGKVPLGPLNFSIQAAMPKKRVNNAANPAGGFFDGFPFDNQPVTLQERKVILPQQIVEVRELPSENKPDTFRGAIGQFRFSSSNSQSKVKFGEPLVVTLQVEGEGNFDRIDAPPLIEPEGWRAYPAEASFAKSDDTGLRGVKTFRIALVPEKAHTRTPQFEFTSFDPNSGTYQKQQNGISSLEVEGVPPPAPEVKPQAAEPKPPEPKPEPKHEPEPKPLLAEQRGKPEPVLKLWQSREWFWGLQAGAGLLLVGVVGILGLRSHRARQGDGPRLLREARLLEGGLRGSVERVAFFQAAIRAAQLRAEARSGQPAAAADATDISRAFAAESALQEELRWLFEADAEARFAGGAVRALKEEERRRVLELLGKLA
jgi:hypothetical protein